MQIDIRQVRIAEEYEMIDRFMHELHKHEYILFDKTAVWADIQQGYMRHVISMQEEFEGVCLVAYADGVPAGFMFGYVEDQDDSRTEVYEGRELYVSDGYVGEAFRRMGIYRKLNEHLEHLFISDGVKRITRFTMVNNVRMRQFLEEEGYMVTRLLYEKWVE